MALEKRVREKDEKTSHGLIALETVLEEKPNQPPIRQPPVITQCLPTRGQVEEG